MNTGKLGIELAKESNIKADLQFQFQIQGYPALGYAEQPKIKFELV